MPVDKNPWKIIHCDDHGGLSIYDTITGKPIGRLYGEAYTPGLVEDFPNAIDIATEMVDSHNALIIQGWDRQSKAIKGEINPDPTWKDFMDDPTRFNNPWTGKPHTDQTALARLRKHLNNGGSLNDIILDIA